MMVREAGAFTSLDSDIEPQSVRPGHAGVGRLSRPTPGLLLVMVMMVMMPVMTMMMMRFLRHHCVRLRLRFGLILHVDGDDLGLDRRLEGNMGPVAQHELQRVLARRQRHRGLGLSLAEMDMLLVDGNGLGHFLRREPLVDE